MKTRMFVMGATGFLGKEAVTGAVEKGFEVRALVRSEEGAHVVQALGATAVRGDANDPAAWINEARGAKVLVDLVQPKFPKRFTEGSAREIATYRQRATEAVLTALKEIPEAERPLYLSVSGTDDLEPDANGVVSHASAPRIDRTGFAVIGLGARDAIVKSGVRAAFVYLGTVYGAGKAFADAIFPGIVARKMPVIGDGKNRLSLIHVRDAARALAHLAALPDAELTAHPWVVVDRAQTTQRELLDCTAKLLDAKRPRSIPKWIASLVVGSVLAGSFARDLAGDPAALLKSGFRFEHPDTETGLADAVTAWKRAQNDHALSRGPRAEKVQA